MKIRSGTSMIELVISIVVMGIALMSLPLILTQVQNSDALSLQQEAILAAKTKIGNIMTYDWDKNSYVADRNTSFVLDTNSSVAAFNRVGTTIFRIGHIDNDGHRKMKETTMGMTTASLLGSADVSDTNITIDDVDDLDGETIQIALENVAFNAGNLDYIFDINLTTHVNYAQDSGGGVNYSNSVINNFSLNPAAIGNTSNIKAISVQATGTMNTTITLRAFSCNIGGESAFAKKAYP